MSLSIVRLSKLARLPTRATKNSVGFDLYAYLVSETGRPNTALIPPRTTKAIPTGLIVSPPQGYSCFVCSRSGMAKSNSIFVTNAPGVIDPDYRGEVLVLLYNGGYESYYVKHEDRIAQLVVLPTPEVTILERTEITAPSTRGTAGFGSTGR